MLDAPDQTAISWAVRLSSDLSEHDLAVSLDGSVLVVINGDKVVGHLYPDNDQDSEVLDLLRHSGTYRRRLVEVKLALEALWAGGAQAPSVPASPHAAPYVPARAKEENEDDEEDEDECWRISRRLDEALEEAEHRMSESSVPAEVIRRVMKAAHDAR